MAKNSRIFSDGVELPHCPRPGAMLYFDDWQAIRDTATPEQKGIFIDSIMEFVRCGVLPDFSNDPILRISWDFVRPKLIRDQAEYNYTIWKNRYIAYSRSIDDPLKADDWLRQVTSGDDWLPTGIGTGTVNGTGDGDGTGDGHVTGTGHGTGHTTASGGGMQGGLLRILLQQKPKQTMTMNHHLNLLPLMI